ncbi:MAG: AarF/UbiB family protein [Vicinamibacterales bacterium]
MHGLPQKIGQILSLADLDDASPFALLPEQGAAAPASDSFAWIEDALGAPLASAFATLDPRGSAASLGQVHAGTLRDGRKVAVKIQYPDIADSIGADLAALGMLAAPLSGARGGFDLESYRGELRAHLLAELDYAREAATLRRFAERAAAIPGLATPAPIDGLCTPRLLTMTWVDGDPVAATDAWPAPARAEAALALVRFFLHGCFHWHEVHADPHAGNLRFALAGGRARTGVVDFGCVKALDPGAAAILRHLAEDGDALSPDDALAAYLGLGFDARLVTPMAARLPAVTRVLFEPFHTDGPYDPAGWRLSARLADVLGDDRWTFRVAGPASLLFLIRAFHGVVAYATRLGARFSWRRALLDTPGHTQASDALRRSPALAAAAPDQDSTMRSHSLKVQVTRAGQSVALLTFPAAAVDHLNDLVPDEHRTRIAGRGLDLPAVSRELASRGYPPGDVVALEDGDASIRVWLE